MPVTAVTCSASPRWRPNWSRNSRKSGARFTHHSSIAPTGTISLSLANNASNGIEPSFAHHYSRNVIREGRKSKEKVDVFSFELLAYRDSWSIQNAVPGSAKADEQLPDYFVTADDISPRSTWTSRPPPRRWVDSSISKTANVPTDFPYEEFKDIYVYAYDKGLKGCTTFRFNPEAFQGVAPVDLVQGDDHRQPAGHRLHQHVAGLGQRALGGVDEEQDRVDEQQRSLDLAAEVGVARRVDDVQTDARVVDCRLLGEDRDALLALEIARVEDPVDERLVRPERARLAEHRVDERGLAVVDVGDDGDVPEIGADDDGSGGGHGRTRCDGHGVGQSVAHRGRGRPASIRS